MDFICVPPPRKTQNDPQIPWKAILSRTRIASLLLLLSLILSATLCLISEHSVAQPDIVVTIIGFPPSLEPGDTIIYTIFFNNTGPDYSPAVWINLTMPGCLTYQNDTSVLEGGIKTGDYDWTFQPVLVGDHSFNVTAGLGPNISDMESVQSEVYLDYKDTENASMLSSTDNHISTGKIPQIDPELLISPSIANPGDLVNITIYINNTGSAIADNLVVDVLFPVGIGYLNDNSALEGGTKIGDYNWSFSSVNQGDHQFSIAAVLAGGLDNGTSLNMNVTDNYSNTRGIWFQERWTDATLLVVAPVIEIEKSSSSSSAAPGEAVDFTIDLRNVGGGVSRDVWVNDTIPEDLSFIGSLPDFESVTGRTYTFHFIDFAPGVQQIFVQAKVNDSAPVGVNLTNAVAVEYTDANGNPRLGRQAESNISVVQLRMDFQMLLPSTQITPKDDVTIEMRFQNEMTSPSAYAWINLTIPEHLSYLSDTSSGEGGSMTQTGKWQFTNVSPGNHSFEVVLLLDNQSRDGSLLTLNAIMVYTDQFGTILGTIGSVGDITAHRPEIDVVFRPESVKARRGEAVELSVYFNNTGSRASERVWINATLHPYVQIVNDTSFEQGGTRVRANFTFENVDIGSHSFQMVIIIVDGSGRVNLSFEFAYLDSDGDFLSSGAVRISAQLLKDEQSEFPLFLLIGIATAASAALVSGLWREESFRLRFLAFFIPLYSRLRRKEVLDNEIRGMIRGYVTANPGDHFAAMREALRLKNGTLAYHLTVLEKERIVKSIRDGKFRRIFPSGMKISETSFPSRIEEMILEIIGGTPGITLKDIASLLGVSSPTASYHIRKLKEMNLIRTERKGISVRHHLQEGP